MHGSMCSAPLSLSTSFGESCADSNYIANTIDPLLASISSLLILVTLVLMIILDRAFGLDRILGGKA